MVTAATRADDGREPTHLVPGGAGGSPAPMPPVHRDVLTRFERVVGADNVIVEGDRLDRYVQDPRGLWTGSAAAAVRPGSVDEVSMVVRVAHETLTPLVPQGGNTGLVAGQLPFNGEVVLSLERLNSVLDVDVENNTMTCEAGVTLQQARAAAADVDRLYPQALASEGSCTIGGNVSTNAGGSTALTYGVTRAHVLGLQVVLADGRILDGLSQLKKDNTGYDLKHLFIGAEGTLGVVTAAVLRLSPRPRSIETAWVGVPSAAAAVELLSIASDHAPGEVTSFELMSSTAIDLVLKHVSSARNPMSTRSPYVVLVELSSVKRDGLRATLAQILVEGDARGLILGATLAHGRRERQSLWHVREMLTHAQAREGASIKYDVSVRVSDLAQFVDAADDAVRSVVPGARPVAFGHVGDGNVHYNVAEPVAGSAMFLASRPKIDDVIYDLIDGFDGSISAEHGIGLVKRERLASMKDPATYSVMCQLKRLLDPQGILNPGKVLDDSLGSTPMELD